MINWTEEDVAFICKNIVLPAIMEATKAISDNEEKLQEISQESYKKIFTVITDRLNQLDYEQERDRRFFLQLYSQHAYINYEKMQDVYKNWCEEFDKLNKDKFFKEKTDE